MEILVFGKPDCARCQTTKHKIDHIMKRHKLDAAVQVNFADLSTEDGLAEALFKDVREVPTTVILSRGEELAKWEGKIPQTQDILKFLGFVEGQGIDTAH